MILQKSDRLCLQTVCQALKKNQIVIIPTDTVYGFSGIVPESEDRIRRIKGRDKTKPFIRLIADLKDIALYSDTRIPQKIKDLMPAPITLIVDERCSAAGVERMSGDTGTVHLTSLAFRCPCDEWLRNLIRLCGKPLYSTSVNRSDCPVLTDVHEMEKEFSKEVFCIVDGHTPPSSLPSTIVDIRDGSIKILRQGSVKITV